MSQSEKVTERTQDARVAGIIPSDAKHAFAIVTRLRHPDMRDLTGPLDISQYPGFARTDPPAVRIATGCVP